ncbi:MAG TPA: hypothetical protein VFE23_06285 [Usitatibacter sp.]|nr:hypothetical protein [Usitatibacter sp.]
MSIAQLVERNIRLYGRDPAEPRQTPLPDETHAEADETQWTALAPRAFEAHVNSNESAPAGRN